MLKTLATYAIISLALGAGTAIATDNLVQRSYGTVQSCLERREFTALSVDCENKVISDKGWPFATSETYANGKTRVITADSSGWCIGGCSVVSVGGQFMYNVLLLSAAYGVILATVFCIRHYINRKSSIA